MTSDSFYIFRNPGETMVRGACGHAEKGMSAGFIIAPFNNDSEGIRTIIATSDLTLDKLNDAARKFLDSCNGTSAEGNTLREEHRTAVERLKSELNEDEKCILARGICGEGTIDYEKTFKSLCRQHPNAFVYCMATPTTGLWIGATPEKLISITDNKLETMALAGTMPAADSNPWSQKNIKEHQIVADFIGGILSMHFPKCEMDMAGPETINAGNIKHLRTRFSMKMQNDMPVETLQCLLGDLSPTPALCGFPRPKAMRLINELEKFPRGYYGGYLGYISSNAVNVFVILRSIKCFCRSWQMYAGGGILKDSDADEEWLETERKAQSILDHTVFRGTPKSRQETKNHEII